MKHPRNLYVITTARKRDSMDWCGEAIYFGIDPHNEDPRSPIKFTVDSWNNLHKYCDISNAFFIFDEQRVVGYGSWTKAFLKICKKNHFILLSATPGDTWMDYIPIFIANGFYRNKTEFITRHVIYSRFSKYPKIERYIDEERLECYRDKILVKMNFEHSMISHKILVECDFDQHDLMRIFRGRWNVFENKPIQQAGEWCLLMREVVNSHHSRLEKVLDIFEEKKRIIVFYNFDYELEALRDGFNEYFSGRPENMELERTWGDFENDEQKRDLVDFGTSYTQSREEKNSKSNMQLRQTDMGKLPIIAEYNGHKHEPVPEGDSWVYLVQYNAASEAWNCITTDTIVFYSLNYSYKIMEQASGRIRRMNSPYSHLYYYVLYSKSVIDKSILTALKNKKEFNARRMYNKTHQDLYLAEN